MLTKSSIARGPNFHLYSEWSKENEVYLELEGVEFEARKNRVNVAIPIAIWEVIRRYPGVDLSMADISDVKMRQAVEYAVQERSRRYAQADEHVKRVLNLTGLLIFGAADTSQDEQIARGWEYYTQLRKRQRKIKQDIADLRQTLRQEEQHDEQ